MNIRSLTAPNPGPFTLTGTHTWLLGETAVIDPGPDIDSHIAAIIHAMPRLDTIFITHRHGDHAPAALPLKQQTGARIIAPLDIADIRIAGGETFDVDGSTLEAIATPGHTREHICYLTANRELFTGDTILGEGTTVIFPPDGDMSDYLRSLATLRAREPRRIHPAHGPTRDDAVALIDEYIAHRLERERQIIESLASGGRTTTELRTQIYPLLDERLHHAAELQVTAHLLKLQEDGSVREESGRYLRTTDV